MKCSDMRKCVYKTVEAFLDPMSSVFFWALWLSSMDISQTRFWGRSEVFALCLCFSNSKKRIIVFISYERLLNLPPRKTIFIGWVETAVVATIVEGIILSPANILIRRVIIDFLVELFSLCHLFSETSLRLTGMWFQKWETNNFCSFSQKLIVNECILQNCMDLAKSLPRFCPWKAAQWSRHQLYWGLLMTAAQMCFELGALCFGITLPLLNRSGLQGITVKDNQSSTQPCFSEGCRVARAVPQRSSSRVAIPITMLFSSIPVGHGKAGLTRSVTPPRISH